MPELPDILTYIGALESRIVGQRLIRVRIASTFLLRSAQPPIREVEGRVVRELRRIGKRIAIGVENDLWPVLHLRVSPSKPRLRSRCRNVRREIPSQRAAWT